MDFQEMMKQAQAMQEKMQSVQAEIADIKVEGRAGGGLVTISMTGNTQVKAVHIDPSLLKADEIEILQDLIIAAFNDAKQKSEALMHSQTSKILSSMGMPK
ncbi:MAG: YbaB/EbfC family nucleoid-associated protein [Alphaproteobacteria bacterium]